MSSDDLIRRAREAVGQSSDDTGTNEQGYSSDRLLEEGRLGIDDRLAPDAEAVVPPGPFGEPGAARGADLADESSGDASAAASVFGADLAAYGGSDATFTDLGADRPTSGVAPASQDQPHGERPSDLIATPVETPRRGFKVGSLIRVAIVGFIAFRFLSSFLDSSVAVDALAPGTCFTNPAEDVVFEIDPVDCAEPHDYEAIGNVRLDGAEYPGEDVAWETAIVQCIDTHFAAYVGSAYEDSIWWIDAFTPTRESWDDGDRSANCLVFQPNEAQTAITAQTGSARGTGQ